MLSSDSATKRSEEFLTGNVLSLLLKFAIPAILSLLVAEMYNMVDSLFVGRIVGAEGIGGLNIAFPVQRLFMAVSMLVAVGTSTVVSRTLGRHEKEKLNIIIPNALIILTIVISTIAIGSFLFRSSLIMMLGSTENIFPYAKTYISILLIGVLFQGLGLLMSYILTAFGNTKVVLLNNLIGMVFNVILNYAFVVKFNLGVGGAALATVISQITAFIYVLVKFTKAKKDFDIAFEFKKDYTILKGILFIGFSTFIIEISDAVVAVILNKLLVSIGGDEAIIAVGLITKVSMFLFMTVIGISSAMQPIAAYNLAAGNKERVEKIVKYSIIAVTVSSAVLWAFTMIFAKQLIGLFVNDIEIINYTVNAFRLVIAVFPVLGIYYLTIYYYQAKAMVRASFLLSIFRQIVIFIPLVFLMVNILGVVGAWLAYPMSDAVSFLVSLIYIKNEEKVEEMEKHQEPVTIKRTAVI